MVTVPVQLGERSYDIHVGPGLIHDAGPLIRGKLRAGATQRIAGGDGRNMWHGCTIRSWNAALRAVGLAPVPIVLPPGEATKSFEQLEKLIDALLARKCRARVADCGALAVA